MRITKLHLGLALGLISLCLESVSGQGLSLGYSGRGAFGPRSFGQSVGGPTRSLFGPRVLGGYLGGPANASYFGPRYLGGGVGGVALYPALQFQAAPGVVISPNYIPGFPLGAPTPDVQLGAPATSFNGPTQLNAERLTFESPTSVAPAEQTVLPSGFAPNGTFANSQQLAPAPTRPAPRFSFQADRYSGSGMSTRISGLLQRIPQLRSTGPVSLRMDGRTAVLTGVVDSADTRKLIDRIVRLEPGVAEVRNELAISGE